MPPRRRELSWIDHPWRELLTLAWPICVSMLSYSVMTVVDTLFVARLGPSALAGVGLGAVTSFTLLVFGIGLLRAVKVLVSQAIGADRERDVADYLAAGLLWALGLGLVTTLLGQVCSMFIGHLAATVEAGDAAGAYLGIRILGAPLVTVFAALREASYGRSLPRAPMVASVLANIANVALDYTLIVGLGAGVEGAAWASVCASAIEVLALALLSGGVPNPRRGVRFAGAVWRVGLPTGLQFVIELGAFTTLSLLISRISEDEMAAHQIALHTLHVAFLPALAIGEAGSVLAGQAVGADRDDLVLGIAHRAMALVGTYALLCTAALALYAPDISRAFSDDRSVLAVATGLLYAAAIFQIADGANIVARGILRGTGDVRAPAVIGIVTAWLCTPPLTWLLGYELGLGAIGGWLGLTAEIAAAGALLWIRLASGRWRRAAGESRARVREA